MQRLSGACAMVLDILESKLGWLAPTLARLTLGVVFVESGWGKLHNLDKVIEFFRTLGIPAPELQAPFVACVELGGGLCVLLGLLTRVVSVPLAFTMVIAIATAKKDDLQGLSDLFGFSEYLYILLFGYLVLYGPGPLALDRLLGKWLGIKGEQPARVASGSRRAG